MILGDHWSYNFRNDPKRLAFVLARYKFAAKMACKNKDVLELGCSEGIGSPVLAKGAKSYTGIDLDEAAIEAARRNFPFTFLPDDFMGKRFGSFGAVVSLDVIEHIHPEFAGQFFETILANLTDEGICVIGTPNETAAPYASIPSQLGHVNLYTQKRLVNSLREHFHHVLPFGINDEVVHTGFGSMAHYLICVAFHRR